MIDVLVDGRPGIGESIVEAAVEALPDRLLGTSQGRGGMLADHCRQLPRARHELVPGNHLADQPERQRLLGGHSLGAA